MKIKGFDISTEELDNDMVVVNFDKNGRAGGYVSLKLGDDGVSIDIFSGEGDVIGETYALWEELEPTESSHEDSRL